jgi:hypothetical protein
LFDAPSWLVKENRDADDLERISDLSGINGTLFGVRYNYQDAAIVSHARGLSNFSKGARMDEAPAKLKL